MSFFGLFGEDEIDSSSDSDDSGPYPNKRRMLEAPSHFIIDVEPVLESSPETLPTAEALTILPPITGGPSSTNRELNSKLIPLKQHHGKSNLKSTIAFNSLWNLGTTYTIVPPESSSSSTQTCNHNIQKDMIGNGVPIPTHNLPMYNKAVDELYKDSLQSLIQSLQELIPQSIFHPRNSLDIDAFIQASEYILFHEELLIQDIILQHLDHAIQYGEIISQIVLDDQDKAHQQMIHTLKTCREIFTRSYPYNF